MVDIVDPAHLLWLLHYRYVQIDDHWLLTTPDHNARERLAVARIDLLMWHVGGDVDEVTRTRVGDELQLLAPAHARRAADDVDDALERAVVVRAGPGPGLDDSSPSPESLRARAGAVDGGGAVHAEGLWRVGVQLV